MNIEITCFADAIKAMLGTMVAIGIYAGWVAVFASMTFAFYSTAKGE